MSETYQTSWWEYVLDDKGELSYGPWRGHIKSPLMRNLTTGEVVESPQLPVGALYAEYRRKGAGPNDYPPTGSDGLSIGCVTIGGHVWNIDGRASNCTKKDDNEHRCWVRHGTVGQKLTVDKNGLTCAAGAGSFFMNNGKWHGFLRNGVLTP